MISGGSFSFGETQMPPPQRVRGSGCLFSNSLAPALLPPPPLDPLPAAFPPGSKGPWHAEHVPRGSRRWAGAHAAGEGRKVQSPTGGVPFPSTEENPRSCLSCNSKETHRPLPLLESPWCTGQRQVLRLHCSLRSLQTCPCARPAWQVHIPGQVLAGPSELSGGAAEAAEAASEAQGFHLRDAARRVPAPTTRSAPRQCHLQTLTPDECLKITMLPCLPLSFLCTYVGSQWDAAPTVSPGAHWPGARQGAGSGSHRCLLWGAGWLGCRLC